MLAIRTLSLPSELAIHSLVFILVKCSFSKYWLLLIFEKETKPDMREVLTVPHQKDTVPLQSLELGVLSFKGKMLTACWLCFSNTSCLFQIKGAGTLAILTSCFGRKKNPQKPRKRVGWVNTF